MIATIEPPCEPLLVPNRPDGMLEHCRVMDRHLADSGDKLHDANREIDSLKDEIGGLKKLAEDLVEENKKLKPLADIARAREEWERDLIDWMLGYASSDRETSVTKDIELEQGLLIGERDGRRFELELSGSCTIREVDSRG